MCLLFVMNDMSLQNSAIFFVSARSSVSIPGGCEHRYVYVDATFDGTWNGQRVVTNSKNQ